MKIVADKVFGETMGHLLTFTQTERAALARARDIAEQARRLLRNGGSGDAADEDADMQLAEIEHSCRELLLADNEGGLRVVMPEDA